MSAIGPELPPHLLNQSRTPDDDEPTTSPNVIGPQIPTGLARQDENSEDEDDYIPELPPDMLPERSTKTTSVPSTSKHAVGPSMPLESQGSYSDDDDDDDFGPKPLPAGVQHPKIDPVKEFMEKEEKRRREVEEAAKPKALKRDEWMLVPPSSSDLLGNLDPTKLKARQFSRSTAPPTKGSDNSLWTETPAERQQRLADEVSGKKRRAVDAKPEDEAREDNRKYRKTEEEAMRRGVDDYTHKVRGPALISQHISAGKGEEPKDANSGIWDHSRDMSLGGRLMDDSKRNKIVQEAKGLGDRFGAGRSGGFL